MIRFPYRALLASPAAHEAAHAADIATAVTGRSMAARASSGDVWRGAGMLLDVARCSPADAAASFLAELPNAPARRAIGFCSGDDGAAPRAALGVGRPGTRKYAAECKPPPPPPQVVVLELLCRLPTLEAVARFRSALRVLVCGANEAAWGGWWKAMTGGEAGACELPDRTKVELPGVRRTVGGLPMRRRMALLLAIVDFSSFRFAMCDAARLNVDVGLDGGDRGGGRRAGSAPAAAPRLPPRLPAAVVRTCPSA